jgi:hypothetical protein
MGDVGELKGKVFINVVNACQVDGNSLFLPLAFRESSSNVEK